MLSFLCSLLTIYYKIGGDTAQNKCNGDEIVVHEYYSHNAKQRGFFHWKGQGRESLTHGLPNKKTTRATPSGVALEYFSSLHLLSSQRLVFAAFLLGDIYIALK